MFEETEKELAADDIKWAVESVAHGRRLDFVASVLGVKPKTVHRAIKEYKAKWAFVPKLAKEPKSSARIIAEKAFSKALVKPTEPKQDKAPAKVRFMYRREDADGLFNDRPTTGSQEAAIDEITASLKRRRFKLMQRYARHWDMIWFLTRQRMSRRSIRSIYGDECLIWSVGGGVDETV